MKIAIKLKDNIITSYYWSSDESYNEEEYTILDLDGPSNIIPYKTRLIEGKLDNTYKYDEDYLESLEVKQRKKDLEELREKRELILLAFDKYKSNVSYGIENETEEQKQEVLEYYKKLLNLSKEAIYNPLECLKYYM